MRTRSAYRLGPAPHRTRVEILHSEAGVGTQILITDGPTSLLVDSGDGTLRDLIKRKFKFETLKAILLTHEHFDHISGLYPLANFLALLGRKDRLSICTPFPSKRIRIMLRPPMMYFKPTFPILIRELSDGDKMPFGTLRIKCFEVSHAGTSSLGYTISNRSGQRIAVSGDTQLCPNLEREVEYADLALLECTYGDPDRRYAERYGHMITSEAMAIGKKAKRSVLIHTSPKEYFGKTTCCQEWRR